MPFSQGKIHRPLPLNARNDDWIAVHRSRGIGALVKLWIVELYRITSLNASIRHCSGILDLHGFR